MERGRMPGGRPERANKGKDGRECIMSAARELCAEHGVSGATTRQIAERADVTIGTVYRYASTKAELLIMALNEKFAAANDGGIAAANAAVGHGARESRCSRGVIETLPVWPAELARSPRTCCPTAMAPAAFRHLYFFIVAACASRWSSTLRRRERGCRFPIHRQGDRARFEDTQAAGSAAGRLGSAHRTAPARSPALTRPAAARSRTHRAGGGRTPLRGLVVTVAQQAPRPGGSRPLVWCKRSC